MAHVVGKALVVVGALLLLAGIWILLTDRFPGWPSWVGRLPGDLSFERKHVRIYLPLTTSLLLSLVLTALFWILTRR